MRRPLALLLALAAPAAPALAQTTLNVRDADMRAFIADAAKVTGRTFIIDGRVQGKVTVVTDHPLSRTEYFEVFLSTLRANGLVAVPTSGGAFRVQPVDNAAQAPSRVGTSGAARNSLVTDIVRLHSIDAQSALETVRPLVSAQGSVTANRTGNSLVVVDFADNVRRVREVLRRIDADNVATRVVTLKNAGAREIATALQGLAGATAGAAGAPGAAGQQVTVSAVDSSNSVLIRGDAASVARLAAVAFDLDRKAQSGTEIKVVFLENADAQQLLPVLQQLVGQAPEAVQETPLSHGSFSQAASGSSGGSTAFAPTIQQPVAQPAVTAAAAGAAGANGQQPAISTQGGRSAAVVTRFAGANAIVVAGPADIQRQLAEVIRQLDTRREQVEVEAVVAEVSDATAKQLGAQILLANTNILNGGAFAATSYSNAVPSLLEIAGAIGARQLNTNTTTVNGTTTVTSTNSTISDTLAQSALSSILGSSGGFFGAAGKIGDTILGAIINAVKSDTASNLLQTPHIVTLDNQQAHLLVGQEIPITTGQALSLSSQNLDNAFRTVQRENVGISLDVRPQINSSGSIKLYLRQEVSSIAGPVSASNQELILNKRGIENTFTVDDGQIVVIGGLLSDEERRTIEKTPVLGDIPVLGNLFKSKARSRTKTNLMVFIRPTILRTPADNRRLTEQRYGYLRALQADAQPGLEPSIDQLVREYMNAAPPIPAAPAIGSIEDPNIAVPVQGQRRGGVRRGERALMATDPAMAVALPQLTIPYAFARKFGVVVEQGEIESPLKVALRQGSDPKALLEVRRFLARPFDVEIVDGSAFDRLLSDRYAMDGQATAAAAVGMGSELDLLAGDLPTAEDLLDTADDAPAIRLINGIIADAARNGVSDIHIEPYETGLVVRMRIDGVLRETLKMPPHVAPVVVSRVKVMARLDIAERRVPQDGRMGLTLGGKLLDVRVSTLPSRAGERVVLRILDKDNAGIDLDALGMTPQTFRLLSEAITEPNGIILVTGPTGSGKTTTLYAALRLLNDGRRNILTVEDPVEYAIDGVGQTQVNPKVGLTFAAGLRAILRQDPDTVMVGEIRDRETAEIAVQASLTGHLVLSTVHTNDAIGAITRMRDMKVEPFLLASTLRAVIAQRLVRRLCQACRKPVRADGTVATLLGLPADAIVYEPGGCERCGHSGYRGRVGVFEAVRVDEPIRRMINEGGDESAIARHAFRNTADLAAAARELVRQGQTTPEEAVRVSRRDAADVVDEPAEAINV